MHAVLSGGLLPAANFVGVGGSRKYVLDREIADGHVWFTSRRPNYLISMSSIGSEGGRNGPRRSPSSGRSTEPPNKQKEESGGASSKSTQREIIALLKRIRTSIAQRPDASIKRRPQSLREKQPADSVTETPHRFPTKKQVREQDFSQVSRRRDLLEKGQETKKVYRRRDPLEKGQETQTSKHSETQTNKHSMISRPVSNFVEWSPVPPVTSAKEETDTTKTQNSSTMVPKQSELQRIDELKLTELKELAKSKGVKGYSKLKKTELVELLKGVAQP